MLNERRHRVHFNLARLNIRQFNTRAVLVPNQLLLLLAFLNQRLGLGGSATEAAFADAVEESPEKEEGVEAES